MKRMMLICMGWNEPVVMSQRYSLSSPRFFHSQKRPALKLYRYELSDFDVDVVRVGLDMMLM